MPPPETDDPWMGPLPAAPGCDCHVCRPDPSYDDEDRASIDAVLQHGWQVVMVTDDPGLCDHPDHDEHDHEPQEDGGDPVPTFAYTVGLGHRAGHPELLMSGLDHRVMQGVLNGVAQRVLAGRRLSPGDQVEDALAGVPVAVEQVSEAGLRETVLWSGWFHRREPEALVLVWPDMRGVFAWQPGAPAVLDEQQPRRWRVPFEHGGGLAADPSWEFPVPPDATAFSCTHVVDRGDAVLWAARERDVERGEDWSIHCGAGDHESDDIRIIHLAHLVRSTPSLREISDLGLDEEAWRETPDDPWARGPLA